MPAEGFGFLEDGTDVFAVQFVLQLTFFFCNCGGENRAEAFVAAVKELAP